MFDNLRDSQDPVSPSSEADEWDDDIDFEDSDSLNQTRADLKTWTAQDFSSIYIRFRPHLERHAKRFLRNPSQVDEVVQDAFLYLMVTLPELDSEIGVLRFLKWKTKNLCIDVIRASGRAQLSGLDSFPEMASTDPEISAGLEQAEDAAIVRLALSKLNPRHREVLIAAIYEEKPAAVIASQVGLSENATHQLIYRARAAFKKALLGDGVDTKGMSAAAILSVAARKAAQDAKKVGSAAMVLVALLALTLGVTRLVSTPETGELAGPPSLSEQGSVVQPTTEPTPDIPSPESEGAVSDPEDEESPDSQNSDLVPPGDTSNSDLKPKSEIALPTEQELLALVEKSGLRQFNFEKPFSTANSVNKVAGIVISDDAGLFSEFDFEIGSKKPFSEALIIASTDTLEFVLSPQLDTFEVSMNEEGHEVYTLFGFFRENSFAQDELGETISLQNSFAVQIEVLVDPSLGKILSASIQLVKLPS